MGRATFWKYCVSTACGARDRAEKGNFPCTIDAYFIDQLLVDQEWRCAISGMPLEVPRSTGKRGKRNPFGPSLDRIVPELGYVPGNLRVVNNLVNTAMQDWGVEALQKVLDAMRQKQEDALEQPANRRRRRAREISS